MALPRPPEARLIRANPRRKELTLAAGGGGRAQVGKEQRMYGQMWDRLPECPPIGAGKAHCGDSDAMMLRAPFHTRVRGDVTARLGTNRRATEALLLTSMAADRKTVATTSHPLMS